MEQHSTVRDDSVLENGFVVDRWHDSENFLAGLDCGFGNFLADDHDCDFDNRHCYYYENSPADDRYSVLGRDSGNYPVGGRCYDFDNCHYCYYGNSPVDDRYSVLDRDSGNYPVGGHCCDFNNRHCYYENHLDGVDDFEQKLLVGEADYFSSGILPADAVDLSLLVPYEYEVSVLGL